MAERKYVLTKIAAGDYLLPSNDGRRIYRLYRVVDGPSGGLDIPRDRDFWEVYRWTGDLDLGTVDVSDEAWDDGVRGWRCIAALLDTRREAIDAALEDRDE